MADNDLVQELLIPTRLNLVESKFAVQRTMIKISNGDVEPKDSKF